MVHDTCVYVCKRECVYVRVRVRVCAMIRAHMSNTIVFTNSIWHKRPTMGSLSLSRSRSWCLYNQDDGKCQLKGPARLAHAHTHQMIVLKCEASAAILASEGLAQVCVCVCVLLCFDDPILGNRYGPGASSLRYHWPGVAGSSPSTLTTSLTIPVPSSSSSNGPTTVTVITMGLCHGNYAAWAGPLFVRTHR